MDAIRNQIAAKLRQQPSSEEQYLAGLSPTDALGLRTQMGNQADVSPEQRAANLRSTIAAGLSITPIIGNAMSAQDAYEGAGDAYSLARGGDYKHAAIAAGLAGLSGVGAVTGLPFGKAAGAVARDARDTTRIFAGPLSETADRTKLYIAKKLADNNVPREKIWNETGWFQGADKKWRYEIDDSTSRLSGVTPTTDAFGYLTGESGTPIHSFSGIEHPDMHAAYDLPQSVKGYYGAGMDDSGVYNSYTFRTEVNAKDAEKARSILLHERQHAIQNQEGFSKGGNPDMFTPEEISAERQRPIMSSPPSHMTEEERLKYQLYQRIAGEVEARNVQSRMNMTPQERQKAPPWLTQDVPDELFTRTK
jgi:F0F1-type ATP synthase membrane subunit c/vacuolar-type H+-ATPase subunit K